MIDTGSQVAILAPFGDGTTPFIVTEVMFVSDEGAIVQGPTPIRQFLLDNGFAYAEQWVVAL